MLGMEALALRPGQAFFVRWKYEWYVEEDTNERNRRLCEDGRPEMCVTFVSGFGPHDGLSPEQVRAWSHFLGLPFDNDDTDNDETGCVETTANCLETNLRQAFCMLTGIDDPQLDDSQRPDGEYGTGEGEEFFRDNVDENSVVSVHNLEVDYDVNADGSLDIDVMIVRHRETK